MAIMPRTFYHYTARERLPVILQQGLRLGDVPTSQFGGRNGVWFTTDPTAHGHGLGTAHELTGSERDFTGPSA